MKCVTALHWKVVFIFKFHRICVYSKSFVRDFFKGRNLCCGTTRTDEPPAYDLQRVLLWHPGSKKSLPKASVSSHLDRSQKT